MEGRLAYKRILLKLSGESLQGKRGFGIDNSMVEILASEVKKVRDLGVEIAIVLGGGNIYRGSSGGVPSVEKTSADYMGMLATVINGLALQGTLEKLGIFTRVMSAIEMHQLAEAYIRRRAVRHLEKGRVIILVGGTGNPYFTTDTAAALRATEIGADVLLKATKVDGIYSADPFKDDTAVRYDSITYMDAIKKRLRVMDNTAITLCMENNLPIIVFNFRDEEVIKKIVLGEKIGSIIRSDGND